MLSMTLAARHRRVLVCEMGGCRGEVSALRRRDVDVEQSLVHVRFAYTERSTGELIMGPPKSRAGERTVTMPQSVVDELVTHLEAFVLASPDALLFTGRAGQPVRRSNFNKIVRWTRVVADLGLSGLHFYDLRHTGNVLAGRTPGTSLRDLMARMGHDSMRAALIYQHVTSEADRTISKSIEEQIEKGRRADT